MYKTHKKKAFGLVETILAVVIIGVVAAITIPSIQKKSFDIEQKTQFKKATSTLTNAVEKVKADMGYQMRCYYSMDGTTQDRTECAEFYAQLEKELNMAKNCPNNAYVNGCIPDIRGLDTVVPAADSSGCDGFEEARIKNSSPVNVLQDGMIIIRYISGSNAPFLAVDINGKKQPNKWGYDIFTFEIRGNSDTFKITSTNRCMSPENGGKSSSQMAKDAFN